MMMMLIMMIILRGRFSEAELRSRLWKRYQAVSDLLHRTGLRRRVPRSKSGESVRCAEARLENTLLHWRRHLPLRRHHPPRPARVAVLRRALSSSQAVRNPGLERAKVQDLHLRSRQGTPPPLDPLHLRHPPHDGIQLFQPVRLLHYTSTMPVADP